MSLALSDDNSSASYKSATGPIDGGRVINEGVVLWPLGKLMARVPEQCKTHFFFVKKKDGKLCPVQDYQPLNKYTKQNHNVSPLIP
jgi:hypothetical protein